MSAPVLCETIMIICFGLSWPSNVMKSIRSRTAKGKSLSFLLLVELPMFIWIIKSVRNDIKTIAACEEDGCIC